MSEVSTDKNWKEKTLLPSVSFPQSTLSSTLPSCFWEVFTLFFGYWCLASLLCLQVFPLCWWSQRFKNWVQFSWWGLSLLSSICHRTIYPGDPDLDGFYLHLAEVVRMVTKYNSFKGNSIAYVIFLWGWLVLPFPSGCLRPISWHRLQNRECPLIMLRQLKLCHPMQC